MPSKLTLGHVPTTGQLYADHFNVQFNVAFTNGIKRYREALNILCHASSHTNALSA